MALKPLHGMSVILRSSPHGRLCELLTAGYNASETPSEQTLIRLLGFAYFGVDMLYDALPSLWPRSGAEGLVHPAWFELMRNLWDKTGAVH